MDQKKFLADSRDAPRELSPQERRLPAENHAGKADGTSFIDSAEYAGERKRISGA
jgi:hypothetical protein